ncbi:O-antigen ligase family protein [Bacillus sp. FJAT-49711]|uniref:O-antigen ligase family protein n=1 Tax=Bacillus sp. FJAT-49711 TaxID=2833585 RepID=UPI001BC97430|nr:O-antigen ligase family protein [Bacillus sp. FJAT-49711]MBS4218991.1 O-antigen ligase family protein [Bacillus sp. FJAT-49711]
MKISNTITKFPLITILLIIISFPVNYNLGFGIRFVDIIVITFIAIILFTSNFHKLSHTFIYLYIFLLLYLLSMGYGIIFIGIESSSNFFFIYKYMLPFLLAYSLLKVKLEEQQIYRLIKWFFLIFFLLIIYTYLYVLVFSGEGRPSFPFSNDMTWGVDAHLFSAYLSNSLLAFIMFATYKYKLSYTKRLIIFSASFGALLLTGSRTGILTLAIVMVVILITYFFKSFKIGLIKYRTIFFVLTLILLIPVAVYSYDLVNQQDNYKENLINRALNFNLAEDQSSLSRLNKARMGLELVNKELIFIGVGMQSTEMVWFDNSIANIVVSSGYLGLIAFIFIIVSFIKNTYKVAVRHDRLREFNVFFVVFTHYILVNMITEYFLVSRSIVPFIVFIILIIKVINIPKFEQQVSE